MFRTIKRIYENTGDKSVVTKAYKKGWITESQMKEIIGE